MKLLYHKSDNIGDFINEIIFDEIIRLPSPSSHVALGIGTILGMKKPQENTTYHVFGSGLSLDQTGTYGSFDLSKIDQYKFHGVRGPLTATAINPEYPPKITSDFAYLLPSKIKPSRDLKADKIGFVPHKDSLLLYDRWESLLQKAGITFISPLLPPQEFVDRISECSRVMCEAMHGAILCDAYGIPWYPVFTFPGISRSKWHDWLGSMGHQDVKILYFRGPRDNKWKHHVFARVLGNSLARITSLWYEAIRANIFLINIMIISKKPDFHLSNRTLISKIVELQQGIIRSFLSELKN